MADSMNEARDKEQSRLMMYQDVFRGEKGQQVLKDLQSRWLFPMSSKDHAAAGNGVGLAYIAAQRELVLTIMNWVTCDVTERVDAMFPQQEEDPQYGKSESNPDPREWFTGDDT